MILLFLRNDLEFDDLCNWGKDVRREDFTHICKSLDFF